MSSVLFLASVLFLTPGFATWTWPEGVDHVYISDMWGGGGSGGGANDLRYTQGGAGGSSAWIKSKRIPRPASGVSKLFVGDGGAPIPANTLSDGNLGQPSLFWIDEKSFDPAHPMANFDLGCSGGGPGQGGAPGSGGDGGYGGVYYPTPYLDDWILGGQGQASSGGGIWHPMGAPAPRGGIGGNNQQDGMQPGSGGAPGYFQLASGKGGPGKIVIWIPDN